MNHFELLLVSAGDYRPILAEGLPADRVNIEGPPERRWRAPRYLCDDGDPNDLTGQRWGVIAPEGPVGDRLLALIEPLSRARQSDIQDQRVPIYRVPPKLDLAAAWQWKEQILDTDEPLDQQPRYLLLLGDFDETPLSLQQTLHGECFVGRLAFADARGYEAYVDKVLRWERSRSDAATGRLVIYAVHDGSRGSSLSEQTLITPGLQFARRLQSSGRFPASDIMVIDDSATSSVAERLLQLSSQEPAVLWTVSSGLGRPVRGWSSTDEQRQLQGAMSLGSVGCLTAADLGQKPLLPGGVWLMLGSYGAGTQGVSDYQQLLTHLKKADRLPAGAEAMLAGLPQPSDRPFVAALPMAALQHSDGPLAFIGQTDLAWAHPLSDPALDLCHKRATTLVSLVNDLCKGSRVGAAFRKLQNFFTALDEELHFRFAQPSDNQSDLGQLRSLLWMTRQDMGNYILLGDPAVKLPLGDLHSLPPRSPKVPMLMLGTEPPSPGETKKADAEPFLGFSAKPVKP